MTAERIGATTNATWPTGTEPGDVAILVENHASATPALRTGWTNVMSTSSSGDGYGRISYKAITAEDIAGNATLATTGLVEVWRGINPAAITARTHPGNTGTTWAAPAMTGTPGAIPIWVIYSSRPDTVNYTNAVTPPPDVQGTWKATTRTGIYYSSPVAGSSVPAQTFALAGSGNRRLQAAMLMLTAAAPPYNIFRLDANGETGLTPILLGATAAQDTELRWEP